MLEIFHGPHKNPPALAPTYLMYSLLQKTFNDGDHKTIDKCNYYDISEIFF